MERHEQLYVDQDQIEAVLGLLDKTSVRLLLALSEQERRFGELQKTVHASSKTVSARLKRLESEQLVVKTLYAEVPPRSVYALTEKGIELVSILIGILDWDRGWKLQP